MVFIILQSEYGHRIMSSGLLKNLVTRTIKTGCLNVLRSFSSSFRLPPSAFCLPPSAFCLLPSAFRLPPSSYLFLLIVISVTSRLSESRTALTIFCATSAGSIKLLISRSWPGTLQKSVFIPPG